MCPTKPMWGYVIFIFIAAIIYIANYADPTGIDFSIRPIIREKFFDAFFVMSTKARWTLAHIHYVASSR